MENKLNKTALVIFSGGQDSSTCLLWALDRYEKVETICFDYGQKHKREIDCADKIARQLDVPFKLIKTPVFTQIGDSALLDISEQDVAEKHVHNSNVPASFVPGRNLYFLIVAAMYAHSQNILDVITGVSQEDYSGYPDCRHTTMESLEETLQLGMAFHVNIITPLINMSKSSEVNLAMGLENGEDTLAMTHTCYNGEYPPCGTCPSCKLRAKAFSDAGFPDPLIERIG